VANPIDHTRLGTLKAYLNPISDSLGERAFERQRNEAVMVE
jgi:hypothetical protein